MCPVKNCVYFPSVEIQKWKGTPGILPTDPQCEKVYPISREINQAIIETYEYLQTLPNEKARQKHIKRVEKGLKDQYTPRMKKLSFAQGKLLIKLIDRQSNSTSYELVKAFMGPFKAGFYQTFAALFGASLKKNMIRKVKTN